MTKKKTMTTLEVLRALRRLFKRDGSAWIQGNYARRSKRSRRSVDPCDPDAACWCLLGGLEKVTSCCSESKIYYRALKALDKENSNGYLVGWNDAEGRKFSEVRGLLDRVIERLSRREEKRQLSRRLGR